MEKGFVQVYTGPGKGKTTAATGLIVRALGQGFKVLLVRFLKTCSDRSGELIFLKDVPNLEIISSGIGILNGKAKTEEVKKSVEATFALAKEKIFSDGPDLVVFDEINNVLAKEFLALQEVLELINARPEGVELVLTGRNAPEEIMARADLVTRMEKVKHVFDQGIPARRGIEY
ncbi:MAG: cob(I)yrinic acid a,c-diamide adenosyltransferase [Deltaproteobacteria bacterium]|nr:cob(I)yrinic acid a,c-diamide adenosyltransferase [Deltaproteobacteria bacterium]